MLARIIAAGGIPFTERLAGHLIAEAARKRGKRLGPDDAHELRHLYAALQAGDSTGCEASGSECSLDYNALVDYMDYIQAIHDSARTPA